MAVEGPNHTGLETGLQVVAGGCMLCGTVASVIATQSQQRWDVPPTCTNICPYSMQSQGGFWCSTLNACNSSQPLTNQWENTRFLMFARGMCVGLCDWGFSN